MEGFDGEASSIGDATDKITEAVGAITDRVLADLNAQAENIRADNAGLIRFVLILTGFGVAIAVVGSYVLYHVISTSLAGLQADIETVAAQDESRGMMLSVDRTDEFGSMALALADFRQKLAEIDRMKAEQAAAGTGEVTANIEMVNQAASETGQSAGRILDATGKLSQQTENLEAEVQKFLSQVRAG